MTSLASAPFADPSPRATAAQRVAQSLAGEQRPDGGWGAVAGGPATTEATAWGAFALSIAGASSANMDAGPKGAVTWLLAHQRSDGSWPASEAVSAPSWMTSVALLALSRIAPNDASTNVAIARGASWLLAERVFQLDWRTRLGLAWARLRGDAPISSNDADLIGWPWVEDTYSWVEPTSLALIGLRAAAARDRSIAESRAWRSRVDLAHRMLVDRMTPGGGWNYGNTRVLGQDLVPYPDTTAWALLALHGVAGEDPHRVVTAGVRRLPTLLEGNRSSLARSLGALALRANGQPGASLLDAMAARLTTDPLPTDVRSRALALIALDGPATPFG